LQKAEESLQAANAQRASVDVAPDKTSSNKVEDKGLDTVVTTTTSTTTPSTATLRSFFSERASVRELPSMSLLHFYVILVQRCETCLRLHI